VSRTIQVARFTADGSAVSREFQKMGVDGKAGLEKIQQGAQRVAPALRAVDEAAHLAKDRVGEFAHEAGPLGRILGAIGPAGFAMAAGLGASILVFERLKESSREAVRELGEIFEQSHRLATSTTFLQEWRFAVLGIGQAATVADSALDAFATRLGQVSSEIGRTALKGLHELGFTDEEVHNMRSVEDVLPEIAERISRVQSATERMAIARKLGLDPLLPVLSRGREAFDEAAKAAHNMGYILDEELLHRAAEFNGQWSQAAAVIDVQFKSALVDLAPIFIDLTRTIADATRGLVEFIDQFKDLERRGNTALSDRLGEIAHAREALREAFPREHRSDVDPLANGNAEAGALAAQRGGLLGLDVAASHLSRQAAANRLAFLNEQAAEIVRELNARARNESQTAPRRAETEDTTADANALASYVEQLRQEETLLNLVTSARANGSKASREEIQATLTLKQDLERLAEARRQGVIASDDELHALEKVRQARDEEAASARKQAEADHQMQARFSAQQALFRSLETPIERINREIEELRKQEGTLLTHEEVARGVEHLEAQYRELAAAQREASFAGQVLNGIFQGQIQSLRDVGQMLVQLAANATLQELLATGVGGEGGIGGFFGRVGDRIANGLTGGDRGLAGLSGLFGSRDDKGSGAADAFAGAAQEAAGALKDSLTPSVADAAVKLGTSTAATVAENEVKAQGAVAGALLNKSMLAAAAAAAQFAAAAKADQAKSLLSDVLSAAGGGKGGIGKGGGKAGGGPLLTNAFHPFAENGTEIGIFGGWGQAFPHAAVEGLALIAALAKRTIGAPASGSRHAPIVNIKSDGLGALDADVSHELGPNGEDMLTIALKRKTAAGIARGDYDDVFKGRFGVPRRRIQRG
jgi:hypothetical protein